MAFGAPQSPMFIKGLSFARLQTRDVRAAGKPELTIPMILSIGSEELAFGKLRIDPSEPGRTHLLRGLV